MAETIEKAIVLQIIDSNTGANDSFVDFFTQKRQFRLLAKGINTPQSKNRANLQIGAIVEIEYFKARGYNSIGKLKKAHLLEGIDFSNRFNLKFTQKAINLLLKIRSKTFKVFNAYEQVLKRLGEGINKKLFLFLLAQCLDSYGIQPIKDRCCECSRSNNLCDFSFYKGGFLCAEHTKNVRWNKELKAIYFMFNDFEKYLLMANDAIVDNVLFELLDHYNSNGIILDL
ncbi:DNA repair protein RecO [Mycoplasmopsis mucosicanis]|nr:DNA repair protein RecO [Mycoplasmopsis mucosicanis]